MKTISAKVENARVSLKHSVSVCRELKDKKVAKAKSFLEDLIAGKRSLSGKYYTKASKKILEVLKSAEANAAYKGMDTEKLFVKLAKADKGRIFIRPRRWKLRGRQIKATNIEIVLEER